MTEITSNIALDEAETALILNAYPEYEKIIVEKEFGGGFSETRVFLVLPIKTGGAPDARLVTKIGATDDLQREKDNYDKIIRRALPFATAQVTGFYPLGDQAAIHYAFAGGGAMGETLSLEDYYRAQPAEAINQTLTALLDKTLGETWYARHKPYTILFREEYGRHLPPHEKLTEIVSTIYPRLSVVDGKRVQIPGVTGTYPDPLLVYPNLLNRLVQTRKSFVHCDLHVRNILVDEGGRAWLIDFAKTKERHNLFDFIKLETYIRLMALAQIVGTFSLNDYAQFEQALNEDSAPPANKELMKAHSVIQNIRKIAQKYMGHSPDFKNEYFPALFLYSLSMLKYSHINGPFPTQLMFMTACTLAATIFDELPKRKQSPNTDQIANASIPTDTTDGSTAIHNGSGAIAQGNHTKAVGANGILIDGNVNGDIFIEHQEEPMKPNTKKEERPNVNMTIGGKAKGNVMVNGENNQIHQNNSEINTGGGAYIGGSVNVTNGDFVGRDKITYNHGTESADEIAAIFKKFFKRVEELEDIPTKSVAKMAVQGLETENKHGEQAAEKNVTGWFNSLAMMAPDIFDVVVNTLANPIQGLSTVIQKIAIHLKETHQK